MTSKNCQDYFAFGKTKTDRESFTVNANMSTILEGKEPLLCDGEREAEHYSGRTSDIHTFEINPSFFHRHIYVYTVFCLLIGGATYCILSSIFSNIAMKTLPASLAIGLDPHLQPGEEVVENGYFCGYTPEEAKSNGCRFDLILYSWISDRCYDEELQAEYRSREFQWFKEQEAINTVPQDIAGQGTEETLWLNWDYHIWHCRYSFIQMTRILLNSSMGIPGRYIDQKHAEHCLNSLSGEQWYPLDEVVTVLSLNYSTCYSKS